MDSVWEKMYEAARKVNNRRDVSEFMSCGGVSAAVESVSGRIYTGVCVDTSCTLGICAERNAMFNMLTCGENGIKRVVAVNSHGKVMPPCGACREFMVQLMPDKYMDIEIMLDFETGKVCRLGMLTPDWWI